MSHQPENDPDTPALRISAEDARRIAATQLASDLLQQVMASATVEFGVGQFFGAPTVPVWLVRPRASSDLVGGSLVIAVCPETGRVLGRGREGE